MLQVHGLRKAYAGVEVLKSVNFSLTEGEVHAIVGENGAGKSTFVKILSGILAADSGEIQLDGQTVSLRAPKVARALGIAVVHQDRQWVSHQSALENLFLGLPLPRRSAMFVDWRAMRKTAERVLSELDTNVPLDAKVRNLSPSQQTMLDIARAVMQNCRILILDEPTESLGASEIERLFQWMKRLTAAGAGIIYISHRLNDVLIVSDRVTVLRNGALVETVEPKTIDRHDLVRLIGSDSTSSADAATPTPSQASSAGPGVGVSHPVVFEARGIASRDGRVKDATFKLQSGRVTGLFGLGGAGRTELIETLYGLRDKLQGDVVVHQQAVRRLTPRRLLARRVVMIPENRRLHGLIMNASVTHNITLQSIGTFAKYGWLRRSQERTTVDEHIARFRIRCRSSRQSVVTLSGGNQQKVLFARVLMMRPSILLCDEPTQGVDVGTRSAIIQLLRHQADSGAAVLYVSSDLEEILEVSDEVLVMARGEIVATLARDACTADDILHICYQAEDERSGTPGAT